MAQIVHLTTVHKRDDIRIFRKECLTLSKAGHEVTLVVADGRGDDNVDGVSIRDLGKPVNRTHRASKSFAAFRMIRNLSPDYVHFHDPELIPIGIALRSLGFKVIYDVHEDVPATVRTKNWLPFGSRHAMAFAADIAERFAGTAFHRISAATPHIGRRFPPRKTVSVQNFPLDGELLELTKSQRLPIFAYVGGVTLARGYAEMVAAIQYLCATGMDAELHIAGGFSPPSLAEQDADAFDNRVIKHGQLTRPEVAHLLSTAAAGLVLFQPHPNHIAAQPNKMFEYMSAGLPVIASNYPLWREIVEGNKCGICVDPRDSFKIADAMRWVLEHPKEAAEMGENGKAAVQTQFNWNAEATRLLALYH
ncbi:glycosyltransferase family 4 protein [Manganibacter manganicus]|uniref:Glycosyl transferase n=1 Tax=Manganibacter manganicus TaxID=1873176 RepID=A0A1V8RLQ4_9HYPH|nr:glycosyltransferase family 4 protein [Pseudaminobacter manganicus]OQM74127.1 hypothetical protein BFN67_22590 [Pseudaminobacter manganicus]